MTPDTADAVVAAAAVLADGAVLPDHAVAVSGGRIVWIGPADDARPLIGPRTDVWRHDGLLLPGFFDSHNHLLMTGLGMLSPALGECRSIADLLAVVDTAAASTPPGGWIVPSPAWHESMLAEKRLPTAEELDAVSG